MEGRRKTTSVRQLELLVELLEQHKDLALGRVRSKEARVVAARLWRECGVRLNLEGPPRTDKEWAKLWNDFKCRVRAKLVAMNVSRNATGGGPDTAPTLTAIEERVANIIGRGVGPLAGVRQNQFTVNDENNIIASVMQTEDESAETAASSTSILNSYPAEDQPEYEVLPSLPIRLEGELTSPVQRPIDQAPSVQTTPRRTEETGSIRVREPRRRRAERASRRQPYAEEAMRPSTARDAVEDSRQMILKIEEMRAQTALKVADAALKIAESIDRFSRLFCRQP